jgi:integrase
MNHMGKPVWANGDPQWFQAALAGFTGHIVQQGRAANTIKTYMLHLRTWLNTGWECDPAEYIESIQNKGRSPATAALTRAALIQFFDYLAEAYPSVKLGNPWRALDYPGSRPLRLRTLPLPIRKPRNYDDPCDVRNLSIAMLILEVGVKANEIRNLTVGAIDFEKRELRVQSSGQLAARRCQLSEELLQVLELLLLHRGILRTDSSEHLFVSTRGPHAGKQLTRESIFRSCRSACSLNTRELRKCFAAAVHISDVTDGSFKTAMGYKSAHGAWLARRNLQRALESKQIEDERGKKGTDTN